MPDILTQALATEGLVWICLAALIAGTVRGFAGFGTAMIYLPVASQFLSPVAAIVTLVVMDLFGPLPAVPRAVREADWPDLKRLLIGTILAVPLGLWLLLSVSPDVFRYAVSGISLVLLALLVSGLRYQGHLSAPKVFGVGAGAGVLGGAVGLAGPPVIFFYMASAHSPSVIRATTMLFLLMFDVILIAVFAVQGMLDLPAVIIGVLLVPLIAVGTVLGTAIFDPARERLYRGVAYAIIAASALRGLPIWG